MKEKHRPNQTGDSQCQQVILYKATTANAENSASTDLLPPSTNTTTDILSPLSGTTAANFSPNYVSFFSISCVSFFLYFAFVLFPSLTKSKYAAAAGASAGGHKGLVIILNHEFCMLDLTPVAPDYSFSFFFFFFFLYQATERPLGESDCFGSNFI